MRSHVVLFLALCIPWLAAPGGCEDLSVPKVTTDSGLDDSDSTPGDDDDDDNNGDDDDDDNNGDDDDDDDDDEGSGCERLANVADERLSGEEIQCIEGTFEERGYDFDAGACDDLEGALSIGFGPFGSLWADCQAAEGFGDADCDVVYESCL